MTNWEFNSTYDIIVTIEHLYDLYLESLINDFFKECIMYDISTYRTIVLSAQHPNNQFLQNDWRILQKYE